MSECVCVCVCACTLVLHKLVLCVVGSCGQQILGPAFGRADFSRIFIFEPPDFFADFLAGFFLLIFVGKSAQKNPPGKSPGKSSKIYTTKILQHISADCPGQQIQANVQGVRKKQMLVQGHSLRLLDEAGGRGTSSTQEPREPGQSAQVESPSL